MSAQTRMKFRTGAAPRPAQEQKSEPVAVPVDPKTRKARAAHELDDRTKQRIAAQRTALQRKLSK